MRKEYQQEKLFHQPAQCAGCVLAGGMSTRMKTDKAMLRIDGKPLISIALERFSGFPERIVSARSPNAYAFTNVPVICDERPGMGPLGGLISVLRAAESPFVCFRPVDAPLVPKALHLLARECCVGKTAAVPTYGGRPEPLLACFSKAALPALEEIASRGKYKASDVFSLIDTAYISLDDRENIVLLGNPAEYLTNANDPETFTKLLHKI